MGGENFEGKEFPIPLKNFRKEESFTKEIWVPDPITRELLKKLTEYNPKSYIAYRKMRTAQGATEETEEGREAIAGMNTDKKLCEMYKSKDSTKKYCDDVYIKDDSCMVELYAESPFWDVMNDCGDKVLNILVL